MSDLRRLAEQATPGPWTARGEAPRDVLTVWEEGERGRLIVCEHAGPDAEFIAACDPQTIIALLDERDRLKGAIEYALPFMERTGLLTRSTRVFRDALNLPERSWLPADVDAQAKPECTCWIGPYSGQKPEPTCPVHGVAS
jgi:hypothetical protein